MLFNYFLLASRNIARQRGYALVNTIGLSIGLASALLILMYVYDELSFDTHHPHAAHTYRMGWVSTSPNGERNAIRIQRLKNKLGDWSNASTEVEFHGALAWMVGDEPAGIALREDPGRITRYTSRFVPHFIRP